MEKFKEYFLSKKNLNKQLQNTRNNLYKERTLSNTKDIAIKELQNEISSLQFENLSLKNDIDKLKEKNKELRKKKNETV